MFIRCDINTRCFVKSIVLPLLKYNSFFPLRVISHIFDTDPSTSKFPHLTSSAHKNDKIFFDKSSNKILVNQQSGFRKKHSTETSLLSVTNEWYLNMNKGYLNGVVFLDLKKTFDCVDHSILLRKLELYGIKRVELNWFKSYLSNRIQRCKIGQTISQPQKIRSGVPQGSNLGPLLFLLYINDLPNCLKYTKANMFADDTNLTTASLNKEELRRRLNFDLELMHNWLLANKVKIKQNIC